MKLDKIDQPSLELQLDNSAYTLLSNEIIEKTHELRQMKGEELQGLNMEELQKLEQLLKVGLSRVSNTKDERFVEKIGALEQKGAQMMEDNKRLKQQMEKQFNILTNVIEQGHSSESTTNICSSADPPQGQDNDTSLKLGVFDLRRFRFWCLYKCCFLLVGVVCGI
ncbi:MADS-box protein JOINTLESS-like [Corylus avellana]|uniref:MADS-box protein JOINTLESS-like n=1 Tax=Corylus avellana TaxID=13451 RepID=UPI00286CC60B|nr:MADS-box protein JOINTLESS-like [Corylus avellana]